MYSINVCFLCLDKIRAKVLEAASLLSRRLKFLKKNVQFLITFFPRYLHLYLEKANIID